MASTDKSNAAAKPAAPSGTAGVPMTPWVFPGLVLPTQAGFFPTATKAYGTTLQPQPTVTSGKPTVGGGDSSGISDGGLGHVVGNGHGANLVPGQPQKLMPQNGVLPTISRKRSAREMTAIEKRQRRLEKNRESARECRRRKKEQLLKLQSEVTMIEAENLQLRLKLKVGREAQVKEEEDSTQVTQSVANMLEEGASEQQIIVMMKEMQEKFSDYGRDRISAIEFHLRELRRLLLPTMTTKVAVWVLLQKREDLLWDPKQWKEKGEDPPPNASRLELINDLRKSLEITDAQVEEICKHRQDGLELEEILSESDVLLEKLGTHVSEKNATLDEAMNEVQSVLTPTQAAKFVVWVANNPACMHMLNVIWNQMSSQDSEIVSEKL